MDIRERLHDPEEQLRAALDAFKADLWTSVPCVVESVDLAKQTAVLRPTVKSVQRQPDGSLKSVSLPLLQDVPLHFPSGGGVTMTFPVKAGDETLAVISSRSIDSWHQSGGEQQQVDARTHDLSDAFAFVGFKSNPKALSNVSSTGTQIRSDDGATVVGVDPAAGVSVSTNKRVNIAAAQGVTIGTGTGEAVITGTVRINGELIVNGIAFSTHRHTGVQTGGATTTGPTN